MRLIAALIFGLSLINSISTTAQTAENSDVIVVFDPLFWKDELKLSNGQYNQIQNINREYYSNIYRAVSENEGNISFLQATTKELLEIRSERIWNTFAAKQKRIWKKISSEYAGDADMSAYSSMRIITPTAKSL